MSEKRVRIIDIANDLGVSTATVSNVIHGKTKKISDETVKRVQRAIEEKKYIPSMAGILLSRNSSKIIGVVINNHIKYEGRTLQDPFISSAVSYLSEVFEEKGYFMMIKCTTNIQDIITFASMWNMEGLVIIGFCKQDYENLRNNMHIPFVVYDGFCENTERYSNISLDDFDGGYQMGKYLITNGHKKIMYAADNNICMDLERFNGLKKAMDEVDIIATDSMYYILPQRIEERFEYYKKHLKDFLEYSAIFAASDYYAIELINFFEDNNISVPKDISVAGFDDIPNGTIVRPKLTTIHQDIRKRAEIAVDCLLDVISGMECKNIILPVSLIERQSVRRI